MAIITKGSNLEKGSEVEFTLNITDLLAHASVSGDAYFSDQSNWDKVFINYASEGYQKEILIFKNVDSGATSVANFGVFSGARDAFEIQSIIIMDKQGGYLHVKRSDLVVADFDVDFSAAPSGGGGNTINWDYSGTDYDFSNGGLSGTSTEWTRVFGTNQASGPCYIEFTPESLSTYEDTEVNITMTDGVYTDGPSAGISHALKFDQNGWVHVWSWGGQDKGNATTYAGDGSEVFRIEILADRVEYSKNGIVFYTDSSGGFDLNAPFAGFPPYFPGLLLRNSWSVSNINISGFDG